MRLLGGVLCCVLLSRVVIMTGGSVSVAPGDADPSCTPDVLPNTAVLLDSFNYMYMSLEELWTTNDTADDGNGWMVSASSTVCNNTWEYCGAATSDLDTLTTQEIDPAAANGQQLTVEVDYVFFNLSMDMCSLQLSIVPTPSPPSMTVTCENMSPQTLKYTIDSPTQLFQLRFEANFTEGACVTVSRVRVYYFALRCDVQTIMFATYPTTNHGFVGMGECVMNSDETLGSSLMLTCNNGSFTDPSSAGGCSCREGYGANGMECTECAADYRRSGAMCVQCPANSLRMTAEDEATCTCQANRTTSSGSTRTSGEACNGCISTHFLSEGTCSMCPTNSMANGANDTQCTCIGNFATPSGMKMTTTDPCQGCTQGLFISPTDASCVACPPNSDRMVNDDSSRCACDVGWANNGANTTSFPDQGCDECAADYRRSGAMCVQCPMNSLRMTAEDEATCTCQDNRATSSGSTTTSGEACNACAADSYMVSGSCTACPVGTTRASDGAEPPCSCRTGYIREPMALPTQPPQPDDQCFAVVGFSQETMTVSESDGNIAIPVTLSAPVTANISLQSNINPTVGTIAPTSLMFAGGTTSMRIIAALNNNNMAQMQDPTFMITISLASTRSVLIGGSVEGTDYYEILSVTVRDDDRTTPGPPASVEGSSLNSTAVQLTWQAPDDSGGIVVDRYSITYQVGDGTPTRLTVSGQTLSLTVGNLQPATEYTFTVVAVNMEGESIVMATTVTTTPTPTTTPPTLSLAAIIGLVVGGVILAILVVLIILICVVICRIRVNRRGFYPTYEDKATEPPTMLRYSASLRSISSQTVVPSEARMTTKENEFYV